VHLIGHSFGARVVSFALAGLPDTSPSPVKALTLLQGAYSRFAFANPLPFHSESGAPAGALAGMLDRIDGPMTVCYSSHDRALGTFYPLASVAAGDDAAGAEDILDHFQAMGAIGAYGIDLESRQLGAVQTNYPFTAGAILNIDASDIVNHDESPSGAHSDIFHDELAWVAAAAGGLTTH
jgi:pimeloyl-ACP methyl ester carboxylesterase